MRKGPRTQAFPKCAEEDSNLHGVIPHKALNLARLPIPPPARGRASIAPGFSVASVQPPRYLAEHMFVPTSRDPDRSPAMVNLTKRQQEIFDFIKKYSAKY